MKLVGLWVAVAATVAAVGLNPTVATAAPATDVTWNKIRNIFSTDVLAIQGGVGTPAGAKVLQWYAPATGAVPQDQQWTIQSAGSSSSYWIIRTASTSNWYALTVDGNSTANGAGMIQWWYTTNNYYQQWSQVAAYIGSSFAGYHFVNRSTGKCLGLPGTNGGATVPPSGVQVIQWTCGSGKDQIWDVTSV
jgi:hypothetical protein